MKDNERKLILESFAELYAPGEASLMIQRMPVNEEDETGEKFEEYFGMIQTVFAGEGDASLQANMRLIALKYGYPKKVLLQVKNATG